MKNYTKSKAKFVLCFLDSPYFISCLKQGAKVHMTCIEDKQHKVNICEINEVIKSFIHELINASTNIIKTIKKHKIE